MTKSDSQHYTPVAEWYSQYRPSYPVDLIEESVQEAKLRECGTILEIGCGPATATLEFAARGYSLVCLEPSDGIFAVAKRLCRDYPNVELVNETFERWEPDSRYFDAVVAATSIHWVVSEESIAKVGRLLRDEGSLILLWNLPPEPGRHVRDAFASRVGKSSPYFFGGSSPELHLKNIEQIVGPLVSCGLFSGFSFSTSETERQYSVRDYLRLLSTLTPFIKMNENEFERFQADFRDTCAGLKLDVIEAKGRCVLQVARRLA